MTMNTIKRALAPLTLAMAMGGASGALADPAPAQAPAPIGVFGADMPPTGKIVVSFLPSFTLMQGSRIGARAVSSPYLVTHVISPYTPVGTNVLRLAPRSLSIDTQGFAVAYGLNSDVTLFASTAVIEKAVDMQAFKGLGGSTSLGFSTGRTAGLGDTTVAAIVRVAHDRTNRLNLNVGLSLPTGSTTDLITLLLPNGTSPAKRGFYAMQPGTGTVDALLGAAYSGVKGPWSWGLAYRARVPLDRNAQGWAYGDLHEANAWAGYTWLPGLETTARLNGTVQGRIQGEDPGIRGYAQGADPYFYGGEQVSLYGGVIVGGRFVGVPAAQFGVEAGAPVYQRLNGPQLGRAWQVNVALKYRL
jgi:hypothetical protein